MPNLYLIISTIIAGYNANTSKLDKILSLTLATKLKGKYSKSQSKDKILYILIAFVLYPAMMVGNDYIN